MLQYWVATACPLHRQTVSLWDHTSDQDVDKIRFDHVVDYFMSQTSLERHSKSDMMSAEQSLADLQLKDVTSLVWLLTYHLLLTCGLTYHAAQFWSP